MFTLYSQRFAFVLSYVSAVFTTLSCHTVPFAYVFSFYTWPGYTYPLNVEFHTLVNPKAWNNKRTEWHKRLPISHDQSASRDLYCGKFELENLNWSIYPCSGLRSRLETWYWETISGSINSSRAERQSITAPRCRCGDITGQVKRYLTIF